MLRLINSIRTHHNAVQSQFFVDVKTTVVTTKLGPLWWILDPLILMATYTFVVKVVFDRGGPGYHIFALCGIVTWQSFSRSLNLSSRSIRSNASLIRQTGLPLEIFVLISPIVQSFFYLIGLSIVAFWNFSVVGWHTFGIILLLLPMILIPFGFGLFLSILDIYMPDTGKFLPYMLRMGFYISPILYPPERIYDLENVSVFFKFLYSLNPMIYIISGVRDFLFVGKFFDINVYLFVLGGSIFFVQLGLIFFRNKAFQILKNL